MLDAWTDADGYDSYVGRWSRLLAPRFVEWARLPPDARVLDAGCGTGALSEAVVAAGARTLAGVDLSKTYVDTARARLRRFRGARFEVADASELPFEDGVFDAAVSGLVLNFVASPARMLEEMRRVVRPGGVVAVYVWDYAGKMEMMRNFWDAAVEQDPKRAGPLDEGVRFPLCNPEALARVFSEAALGSVETGPIDQPTVFRDFDDYWTPFLSGQAPAPGFLMSLSEERRVELRERVRARLKPAPDGSIPLVARAWAARGVRP